MIVSTYIYIVMLQGSFFEVLWRSVYSDDAGYTGYLYSTVNLYRPTKLVNTNYADYLGFTLRYLYGLNTGL
jgi:hypothetical protein